MLIPEQINDGQQVRKAYTIIVGSVYRPAGERGPSHAVFGMRVDQRQGRSLPDGELGRD